MTRSVVVIGGQGVLGSFMARGFAADGWVAYRAGRRPEDAADFRLADLDRPETVDVALAGVDLAICTVPDQRLVAERAAIAAGVPLLSIGSILRAAERALLEKPPDGDGVALLHAGLTPGLTTLVARELLVERPDADAVELGFAGGAASDGGPAAARWLMGRVGAGRRPTRRIPFPEPIGERPAILFGRGEEGWFGRLADEIEVAAWVYMGPPAAMAMLRALNATGLAKLVPSRLAGVGRGRVPDHPAREPNRDLVSVLGRGERLASMSVDGEGDYRMTVACALAFGEALMERRASDPALTGVRQAEDLFDLADVTPRLERHGVTVTRRS